MPCNIYEAVEKAAEGDDITIESGTYGSPTPLATTIAEIAHNVSMHGQAGQPRPLVITEAGYGIQLLGENSTVSDLDVENSAGQYGIYVASNINASIDHVISHVSAPKAIACYPPGTLTDSVCWASGAEGIATTLGVGLSATATLRNDTLIASGSGGTAVLDSAMSDSTMTMNLSNTIARGAGADIVARTDSESKSKAIVNADHSNYATVHDEPGGGGSTISVTPAGTATNLTGAPGFINSAAGDFHENPGSFSTIDQGIDSSLNRTTDLDGNPRELRGYSEGGGFPPSPFHPSFRTDIGAYEFIPRPSCKIMGAGTAFGQTIAIQLQCADAVGAPLSYAIVDGPAHGTLALTAATGQALYTPAPGYSGSDSFLYTATSSHGTAYREPVMIEVGPVPVAPLTAPILSGVRQTAKTWREDNALAHITANKHGKKKLPVGTIFSFDLTESASVTFAFTQRASGRKIKGKCVAQTKANRHSHSCNRTVTRGKLVFTGQPGTNKVSFQGRISRSKKLPPGPYTLIITATNAAGQRSSPKQLSFTIVR
ncbi:MAG TPA: Ig-like domain-containing protein [Solirubrobacteraceae bacterium]|nr:Ig-like domain-containing protein [Solirubrobacteraceae bacterium]